MDSGIVDQFGGNIFIFALFIIWKLVEEIIRFKGIKRYRKTVGDNPGHGMCKWSPDDHAWLMSVRDNMKTNKKVWIKLEKFLDGELNK